MSRETVTYIVFGIVLAAALLFDLGLISKKNKTVTLKRALVQTIFWVALAFGFFCFFMV
jgi:tellurite resistance protein TerC